MLKVENVCKSFGRIEAVRNVSFELKDDEILGLAGPNGAGKSTLFNCITNVPYKKDSGKVLLDGEDISDESAPDIFKKGLSRTFQKLRIFPDYTVEEQFMIPLESLGHPNPKEKIDNLLAELDLGDKRNSLPEKITFLEKKRVMLGTALTNDPSILLLDEPISGLSEDEIDEFKDTIKHLKEKYDLDMIIIEHHIEELVDISSRLMILHEGEVLKTGVPEEIVADKEVRKVYIGE